jgi:Domain of unknown function (DUF6487)
MQEMELSCPKCHGAMEEGFVADQTYGGVRVSKWVEGAPKKSFWSGTKTQGKEQVQIRTYRCTGCGYLESYAR